LPPQKSFCQIFHERSRLSSPPLQIKLFVVLDRSINKPIV
jgi:hypothetical protein